jgi:hypothetical protein
MLLCVRAAANYYKAIKNRQQDLKIVHYYYPAGYLYPAVHRTAAHWTAEGLRTDVLLTFLKNQVFLKISCMAAGGNKFCNAAIKNPYS